MRESIEFAASIAGNALAHLIRGGAKTKETAGRLSLVAFRGESGVRETLQQSIGALAGSRRGLRINQRRIVQPEPW